MWSVEHRRLRLRRTARVALVAWVFALAVGVANACLLQIGPAGVAGASPDVPSAMSVPASHGDHEHRGGHDAGAEHDGRANCLKFCADESSTLAKQGGKPFDLPQPALVECDRQARQGEVNDAARAAYRLSEPPDRPRPSLIVLLLRRTT